MSFGEFLVVLVGRESGLFRFNYHVHVGCPSEDNKAYFLILFSSTHSLTHPLGTGHCFTKLIA